jgi:hypothetical protein
MLIELLYKSLTVVIPMIIKYLYFYDNAGNKLHKIYYRVGPLWDNII